MRMRNNRCKMIHHGIQWGYRILLVSLTFCPKIFMWDMAGIESTLRWIKLIWISGCF